MKCFLMKTLKEKSMNMIRAEILGWIPAQEGWDKGVEAQYGKIIPRSILYPVEDYNG